MKSAIDKSAIGNGKHIGNRQSGSGNWQKAIGNSHGESEIGNRLDSKLEIGQLNPITHYPLPIADQTNCRLPMKIADSD
jgi:hypothetical protein